MINITYAPNTGAGDGGNAAALERYYEIAKYSHGIDKIANSLWELYSKYPAWLEKIDRYFDMVIDYFSLDATRVTDSDVAEAAAIYRRAVDCYNRYTK